jgi:hypothetical protein
MAAFCDSRAMSVKGSRKDRCSRAPRPPKTIKDDRGTSTSGGTKDHIPSLTSRAAPSAQPMAKINDGPQNVPSAAVGFGPACASRP